MPTHLYCVLPGSADVAPAGLEGIGGAPVRALDAGGVTAWVSTLAEPVPGADAAAVRAHDAVATAALARGTPLPARFGQRFPSDEGCRSALEARKAELLSLLAEVAGCVEMRILAAPAPASDEPRAAGAVTSTGRAYLEQVRSRVHGERALHERGAVLRASLGAAVGPLARRDAVSVHPGSGAPIAVAHLVRRDDVGAWRTAAEAAIPALRRPGERIAVAGPVAPYGFAEMTDDGPR